MRLDELNPIERLAAVAGMIDEGATVDVERALRPLQLSVAAADPAMLTHSHAGAAFRDILRCMNAFDGCVERLTGYRGHIYLLGDEQVDKLLELHGKQRYVTLNDTKHDLEVLSSCGLLYRFNVALKFGYPERRLMQLRINGWGRHLCQAFDPSEVPDFQRLSDAIMAVLEPFRREYHLLVALCASERRPLDVDIIHQINLIVPFAMVT